MAILSRVSASQVETFLKCKRAWYNGSILGDRAPQTDAQERGEEVHAELEHYGKTGEVRPSEYLEIVQVALQYLGEHQHVKDPYWDQFAGKAGLLLEQSIDMATYESGPSWIGYIDRVVALLERGEVWDYKTLSDFRYAKTPEELKKSVQMVSYAHWLFLNSDYSEVVVEHLCLRMRGRAMAKPVEAIITRAECEVEWVKILGVVREMVEWATLGPTTAEALPPSTNHCSAYGGCFYRPKCGFLNNETSQRRFASMSNDNSNNILATMLATATSVGVAPVAPPLTPAPAPTAAPPPFVFPTAAPVAPPVALPAAAPTAAPPPFVFPTAAPVAPPVVAVPPVALPSAYPAAPAAPTAPPVVAPPSLASLLGTVPIPPPAVIQAAVPVVSILPPDAAPRVSTPAEVGPPPAPPAAPVVEPAVPPPATPPAVPPPATPPAVPPPATVVAPMPMALTATAAPKRRGRPRKEDLAAEAAAQAAAAVAVAAQAPAPCSAFAPPTPQPAAFVVPGIPAEAVVRVAPPSAVVPGIPAEAVARVVAPSAAPVALTAPTPPVVDTTQVLTPPAAPALDGGPAALLAADKAFRCGVEAIFVDCLPQKGWPGEAPVWLDSLMASFTRLAAASAKQPDYALIRYEAKGYLRTAIKVLMVNLPKVVVVTTSTPGSAEFLECVTPYAKLIIRGIH